MTTARWFGSVLVSLSLTAGLFAQAPALNVKMGLWEITTVSQMGGQPPAIDTSQMTPERKARAEAAMQKMMGGHSRVAKTCVTKEKFEKSGFMDSKDEPGAKCKKTITTNTAITLEGSEVCTGEHSRTMQMHIDALSSTSWKGTMKASTTENGSTMIVNGTLTGRWLGANCGTEK